MKGGLHCFRLWLATGSHKLHRTTPGFCGSQWRFIVWKCHLPIGRHFVQDSNMLNQIRKYILAAWHGTLSASLALLWWHYNDVIMGPTASHITSLTIVFSTVYSDAGQRKHQSSASLAFVWGIHRGPVNSPHKWPVTRKMFPFDDVIVGIHRWPVDSPHKRLEIKKNEEIICWLKKRCWSVSQLLIPWCYSTSPSASPVLNYYVLYFAC